MSKPEEYQWKIKTWKMWHQREYMIYDRYYVQIIYEASTPGFSRNLTETVQERFGTPQGAMKYLTEQLEEDKPNE